jgi:Na+/H+ antiporter NhaB
VSVSSLSSFSPLFSLAPRYPVLSHSHFSMSLPLFYLTLTFLSHSHFFISLSLFYLTLTFLSHSHFFIALSLFYLTHSHSHSHSLCILGKEGLLSSVSSHVFVPPANISNKRHECEQCMSVNVSVYECERECV